jgi:hypothetical protein
MVEVIYNEKLLIQFFQDSLSDAALTWYIWLDNTKIKTWKDLVDAFIRQYKFNMDVGPDRLSLQAMKKDNKESMREYTQRWHETLVQVNPSLLEKEMINFFSNTFKAPYFEYLVRSSAHYFSNLVVIVERFEQVIRLGKIVYLTEEKSFTRKRKETEFHNIEGGYKGERKNYQKKDT